MEKDMAVCLVIFNPANSKRILMNYHYIVNEFKLQDLPVFSLELVYEGRQPQIADAFHVYAKSYMFHKENLCRVLETKIPETYTKLAFIDADVVFKDKEWYSKVSQLLETHDVVQPFERCNWIDLTYRKIMTTAKSICLAKDNPNNKSQIRLNEYHPGFVWCFTREYYRQVGFFDIAIAGSGDTISCIKYLNFSLNEVSWYRPEKYVAAHTRFLNIKCPAKVTYLKNSEIFHLYHGSNRNRKYNDRFKDIFFDVNDSIEKLVYKNEYGVYEWIDKDKMNPRLLKYFLERYDDDLSCECLNKL